MSMLPGFGGLHITLSVCLGDVQRGQSFVFWQGLVESNTMHAQHPFHLGRHFGWSLGSLCCRWTQAVDLGLFEVSKKSNM